MKIESALKYFNPKSMHINDTSRNTSPDALNGTDMMGALGYCQSKVQFGMAAFLGKAGISEEDKHKAITKLAQYAKRTAPKLVAKAAGAKLGHCAVVLAKLAFEEYAHSAGSTSTCKACNGRRFITVRREVVKYPGYIGADCEEKVPPRIVFETVREVCSACQGKGVISARCRCNGTGQVRDMEESKRQGVPVYKDCERCSGLGFRRSPGTKAYRAISALLPDLQERTWNRNWKPFFDRLVDKCMSEENRADAEFQKVTQ
ncbi:antitermination protein [Candidatus Symbiopectobacterium sp. NZEC127]|uniref:antitermination protein Q n=1 Tax=Candidatus Symbiopectobacterium sp. NZEC127 TaxID=2820472 RepID=UPI0022280DFF|nr:antitermination protein [Candidatus Symbiopectobacterium sp. NZEC127]MCW2485741.1 antitermination protein [Candidatus Symbiopectobacterium sp. NZEC127]